MYIVEVQTPRGVRYIIELTATSITLTDEWRKAARFPVYALPNAEECESEGITLNGYCAV